MATKENPDQVPTVKTLTESQPDPVFDTNVTDSIIYGYAPLGTKFSEPGWKIKKVTLTGGISITTYADGDMKYDNVWDDRLTLNYSR